MRAPLGHVARFLQTGLQKAIEADMFLRRGWVRRGRRLPLMRDARLRSPMRCRFIGRKPIWLPWSGLHAGAMDRRPVGPMVAEVSIMLSARPVSIGKPERR